MQQQQLQIPCPKLQVENGHVSLNEMVKGGTVHATIFCKEGFILEGRDTLTCTESGKWDGEVPNCIGEVITFLSKSRVCVYHT